MRLPSARLSVSHARRLNPPGNTDWEITLRPNGEASVEIAIEADRACTESDAICTPDGRPLSSRLEVTIPRPVNVQQIATNADATGKPGITGTVQMEELLTTKTSSIQDTDGLENVVFKYVWPADDAKIDGATSSTYTLTSGDADETIKVKVTFIDDAGHAESLTSDPTSTVAVAGLALQSASALLTASTHDMPVANDGSTTFTLELRLSESPKHDFSYRTLWNHAFTVTGGEVAHVRRLEHGKNVRWKISARPDSNGAVAIVLPVTTDCEADSAICTNDGRMLSNRLEIAVPGPGS